MKVLIISTYDISGGAARAAFRLLKGLQSIGVDAYMLVLSKESDEPKVIAPVSMKQKVLSKIYPSLNGIVLRLLYGNNRGVFSTSITPHQLDSKINEISPDIVNLHWVTDGFLKVETLRKIQQPIVWSMHDMWAFTGGCHYDFGCEKYKKNCGACPALHSHKYNDMSAWLHKRKRKTYGKVKNLTIVALSRWLGKCAAESSLLSAKRIEVLPNGIDTEVFKPVDKITARKMLNIPLSKKFVLFGAMNPQVNPIKGYSYLVSALDHLENEEISFLIFGTSQPQEHMHLKYEAHYLGRFGDDLSLAVAYSAADVVVVPSLQENLSNVIMESLACGTPVVAFDIGGNADLIEHKKNGYLAKALDTVDLARGIEYVLADADQWHDMSADARQSVVEKYNLAKVANLYKHLFLEILSEENIVNLA